MQIRQGRRLHRRADGLLLNGQIHNPRCNLFDACALSLQHLQLLVQAKKILTMHHKPFLCGVYSNSCLLVWIPADNTFRLHLRVELASIRVRNDIFQLDFRHQLGGYLGLASFSAKMLLLILVSSARVDSKRRSDAIEPWTLKY